MQAGRQAGRQVGRDWRGVADFSRCTMRCGVGSMRKICGLCFRRHGRDLFSQFRVFNAVGGKNVVVWWYGCLQL